MSRGQEKTPGENSPGVRKENQKVTTPNDSSIPSQGKGREVFEAELSGCYVVVAQIKSPGPEPRYRRRFYANLPSAQRAVDRAVMQGKDAHLILARLTVVGGDTE